jgi:hypothetical protein
MMAFSSVAVVVNSLLLRRGLPEVFSANNNPESF